MSQRPEGGAKGGHGTSVYILNILVCVCVCVCMNQRPEGGPKGGHGTAVYILNILVCVCVYIYVIYFYICIQRVGVRKAAGTKYFNIFVYTYILI
jgi:hypothetical protein